MSDASCSPLESPLKVFYHVVMDLENVSYVSFYASNTVLGISSNTFVQKRALLTKKSPTNQRLLVGEISYEIVNLYVSVNDAF